MCLARTPTVPVVIPELLFGASVLLEPHIFLWGPHYLVGALTFPVGVSEPLLMFIYPDGASPIPVGSKCLWVSLLVCLEPHLFGWWFYRPCGVLSAPVKVHLSQGNSPVPVEP